ncbi:Major facilitator superfamily domain, general substrate transporter [Pseudocohnilembus persalinus]|uniref:Major facilitator superfamily domain, general substrate transporter n=1 Tax=Pseudocohnilembus persalinus TaxID=266149 RepID=A0A0V0QFL2_PSEPJ|nr:Major facilitator superfamily domain, general substrate transporter [Pseudocohnilembus persalinus]|eukprot:KRX00990.1 Major facilitator superfamily domain, general substrate transporter [Pseudocohnilembus persalinus]
MEQDQQDLKKSLLEEQSELQLNLSQNQIKTPPSYSQQEIQDSEIFLTNKTQNNQELNLHNEKNEIMLTNKEDQQNDSSFQQTQNYNRQSSSNDQYFNSSNQQSIAYNMKNQINSFFYQVGNADWYQIQAFAQFSLQALCVSWFLTSIKFYFETPNYQCPQNYQSQNELYQNMSCEEWVCYQTHGENKHLDEQEFVKFIQFDSFYSATISFGLVCNYAYLRYVLVGISFLFTILGLLFFGYNGDNFGRKQSLMTCWKIFTIGFLIFPFMQVFPLFLIGYCLCSFSCYPAIVLQITLLNEQTTGKTRQRFGAGIWFMISFGQFIFVILAYLLPNWRYLAVLTGSVPVLCINWVIKVYFESARFYYPTNKLKAIQILNKIATVNNKPLLQVNLEESTWVENWQIEKISVLELFKYPSLKKIIIPGYFMMLGLYFLYYGSEQEIFLFQGVDYDIRVLCITLSKFAGFANEGQYNKFLNSWGSFKTFALIFALISRFFCAINNIISFIYFAEIFPTAIRCIAIGVILTTQQIAYFTVYAIYGDYEANNVYSQKENGIHILIVFLIMLVAGVIGFIPSFKLHETKDKQLQDEISEIAIAQHDNFLILDKKKTY